MIRRVAALGQCLARLYLALFYIYDHPSDSYRQHRVFKRGRNYPIRFSTLEYTGLLTVEDPDCFRQTLFHGIGKSRALGCGLLLVKPVRN